ncbi:MAG: hypothetical protein ACTSXJ_08570 [Candidatus Baldrarchaeia archaeon]
MVKRTTVILDDDVYEKLVRESVRRYGTTKAISKVLNELLREALSAKDEIIRLLYSDKVVKISARDFEEFRRELSGRIDDR